MNLAKTGTVSSVKQIAQRTLEVTLKVPEDFTFLAGQYIWLMIPELTYPDPRGNTRMFSIASSPSRKGEVTIVFRTSDSGYKKTLCEMAPGTELIFSGPYGHMVLPKDKTAPIVLIAGGVGITPFLSMIRFSTEVNSGHRIILIYANTNKSEAVYLSELNELEKKNPHFICSSIFGRLREIKLKKALNGSAKKRAIWSIAGPQGFVDFVAHYLNDQGIFAPDITFEELYPRL